jgi:hypothetical protein
VAGQDVTVKLPGQSGSPWQAMGYGGRVAAQGVEADGPTSLGKLPVGYYTVTVQGNQHEVSIAVVAPLTVPVPADSPLGVGGGAFFKNNHQYWDNVASLVALAGVNWERELVVWKMVQPQKNGELVQSPFDGKVEVTHHWGLHLLRIVQGIPDWATHEDNRFPSDLRDVYQFYRSLATRWKGQVQAFEPSNETDVDNTGAEIATYQKVVYLALKAGNPNIIVGSTAFSFAKDPLEIREFEDNDGASYFDTLNFHHYATVQNLPQEYETWRQVASGKPMWSTEFNNSVQPVADPESGNPGPEQMKLQAELLPKLFAESLYLGAQNAFYFTFPNHPEGGRQYGILQTDLTPRPAYLSLAAVGRLLAGAKAAGQLELPAGATAYAFHAVVDGTPRDVLVAWSDRAPAQLRLSVAPVGVFDVIGREFPPQQSGSSLRLAPSPIFVVLPEGSADRLGSRLHPPPSEPGGQAGQASPIVLQAVFSNGQMLRSNRRLGQKEVSGSIEQLSRDTRTVQLFAYNFSSTSLKVNLEVQAPRGWQCSLPKTPVVVPPLGRVPIPFDVSPGSGHGGSPGEVRINASGPGVGHSILEIHLEP